MAAKNKRASKTAAPAKREVKKINGLEKELFSDSERLEMWIAKYWKRATVVALIVIIAGIAVFWGIHSHQEKIAAAEAELSAAAPEQLPALLAKSPDLKGASFARLKLARHQVGKKDYQSALANYAAIIADKQCKPELKMIALREECQTLELFGDLQKAAEAYRRAAVDPASSSAFKAEAVYQAARLLIALKKFDDAKALLAPLAAQNANSPAESSWQEQAKILYAALKNGDFNAPAAPAKPAVQAKPAPAKKAK